MKPALLYFFTFLLLTFAKAQPVITSGGLISVGDVFNFQYASAVNVNAPTLGANQVWDYSGLIDSNATYTDNFIDPSTTPYAALFPGATVALSQPVASLPYYTYYVTNTNTQLLGSVSPDANGIGQGGDTVYYHPPLTEFQNPFTYNSFARDSTDEIFYTINGRDSFPEFPQIDSVYGVGYGTLKLPNSLIYSNVLEVENISTIFGSQTFTIDFFVQGIALPVLEIEVNGSLSNAATTVQDVYYLSNSTTTPLTWLGFKAIPDGSSAQLSWQTANELNTDYFTVERSSDGIYFTDWQQVKASGKASINTYTTVDAQPLNGKNYYRIRETDNDGKNSYSSIVELTFGKNNLISVMPNLIRNGDLTLVTNSTVASKAQLYITDMNGKIVQSSSLNISEGYNSQVLNIDKLSAGKYFIIVSTNTGKQTIPFIKE